MLLGVENSLAQLIDSFLVRGCSAIKGDDCSHPECLAPVDMEAETCTSWLHLRCSQQELHRLEAFVEAEFLPGEFPYAAYGLGEYPLWPRVLPQSSIIPVNANGYRRVGWRFATVAMSGPPVESSGGWMNS